MQNSLDNVSDPTDDLSKAFRKVVHFVFMLSLITADVEDGLWNPTTQRVTLIPKAHWAQKEPLRHNSSHIQHSQDSDIFKTDPEGPYTRVGLVFCPKRPATA